MFMMASIPTAWASEPVQAPEHHDAPPHLARDELVQLVEPQLAPDDSTSGTSSAAQSTATAVRP